MEEKNIILTEKFSTEAEKRFFNTEEIKDFSLCLNIGELSERIIALREIEEDTGNIFEAMIRFWNRVDEENNTPIAERKPIKILIDSDGGLLLSALTIIDAIKLSKTPVWTINIGKAYSGGFLVFLTGNRRISYPSATFLFHEGSNTVGGDAHKFQNQADFYKELRKYVKRIILSHTKITEEKYNEKQKDDWWFFADEGIEYGIVDEIATELI